MRTQAASMSGAHVPLTGVIFIISAMLIYSMQDVVIKSICGLYPLHEIVFVRSLVALGPILYFIHREGGFGVLRTKRFTAHLVRSLVVFVSFMLYYLSLSTLPLAVAVALFFMAPLFTTALSAIFLKERVGLSQWGVVTVGFLGLLVIVKPGAGVMDWGALFSLGAAVTYAVFVIMTRRLGQTEGGSSMSFHSTLFFLAASGLLGLGLGDGSLAGEGASGTSRFLLGAWVFPTARDMALMALCGLISGFGTYFLSQAYRLSPAAMVAPFEYVALPLGITWGYAFWSEIPDVTSMVGMMLIMGTGLYSLKDEILTSRRRTTGRIVSFGVEEQEVAVAEVSMAAAQV